MKTEGIVRKVDDLGRIVIPKSIRQKYGISEGDAMEIFDEDGAVVMRKLGHSCVFCRGGDELICYKEKFICKRCIEALNS